MSREIKAANSAEESNFGRVLVGNKRNRQKSVLRLCFGALVIVGGFGLGVTFLVLDIFRHKTSGLFLFHTFGLWMSLAAGLPWLAEEAHYSVQFPGSFLLHQMFTALR